MKHLQKACSVVVVALLTSTARPAAAQESELAPLFVVRRVALGPTRFHLVNHVGVALVCLPDP